MEFDIEDIIHGRLSSIEFYKKYDKYIKQGIMIDTAPLFLILIGRLTTNQRKNLLREFGYSLELYNVFERFLKLCKIDLIRLKITPQILFELVSHFQKSYMKVYNENEKKEIIDEFFKAHTDLLKKGFCDIGIWDTIADDRIKFLECADISFLLHAESEKYITLLTQDYEFYGEGTRHSNLLTINFDKIIGNADKIPEELPT